MWIPREIESLVVRRAAQRPVVVLTGPRQTGKTSLVKRLFPDHDFVSLDLPSEAEQAERDPRAFLGRHPPPLVVDEVQYAPGLFRHLKTAVDSQREEPGRFILTGSQTFTLMQGVSESLAGRADVLRLEGLSFSEIRTARPETTVLELLFRGGFPELHARPDIDASGFYRSYVATYLERDLRQMLRVTSLRQYERFLRACALRTAQLLNKADLARDVGISGSTAGEWMSVLEASGLAVLLEPWFSNRTKSMVKTPKLYLGDTGLAAFLMGLSRPGDLCGSPFAGALWETLVAAEIRRRQMSRDGGSDLWFWADRSREVDFLINRGGIFDLAEAKWAEHPGRGEANSLRRVAAELSEDRVRSRAIICRCANPYPLAEDVQVLSLGDLDALIFD
jgi:predicted AAA+ superfamily ATPase